MKKYQKYYWLVPALFVSCQFGIKLFEGISDPIEFANIISVVIPNLQVATLLAYVVGIWDFLVGLSLLIIPSLSATKKYSKYIFIWVMLWPLVPSSLRYFGSVAEFEVGEVAAMIIAAIISFWLYKKYSDEK